MIEYEILIREVDPGEYRAQVREFPDLTIEYANSPDEAYRLMIDAIEATREYFKDGDRAMPPPLEDAAK